VFPPHTEHYARARAWFRWSSIFFATTAAPAW